MVEQAEQRTEPGDLKGMNEAYLLGKGEPWSMPPTLPYRTGVASAKKTHEAIANNFAPLGHEHFTVTNPDLPPQGTKNP